MPGGPAIVQWPAAAGAGYDAGTGAIGLYGPAGNRSGPWLTLVPVRPELAEMLAAAARLGTEIEEPLGAWDAAEEVDTNLGADVEEAGRRLGFLAGKLAAVIGRTDPLMEQQLLRFAARLGEEIGRAHV